MNYRISSSLTVCLSHSLMPADRLQTERLAILMEIVGNV